MAEPIEMQFGMLSQVGSEKMYYIEVDAPMGRGIVGVSGQL